MIRTRKDKKKHEAEQVTDRSPLAHTVPNDHPSFLAMLRAGDFEGEDLPDFRGKFRNELSRQVYYLMRLGARRADIAEFFGVSPDTVTAWAERNEDFRRAARQGSMMFGMKVAETLGQRALGYEYTETEVSEHMDKHGNVRKLKKVATKHMAPDVTAIIFYLKNRHRDAWADVNRVEVDSRVDITTHMDMQTLTEAEREMVRSIAIKNISATHGTSNN